MVRYDDMRIDRALIKEYQRQLEIDIKGITGLNDIESLLADFEGLFARYIGVKYSYAVNSGSDALQLALMLLGVGKGCSVLMPNLTYPADALSVVYTGAEPVFVDAGRDLQIDEKLLAKSLRKDTKAIIAAHMFARPCNIEVIMGFARKKGLKVIEDCCQAESSLLKQKRLGSFADISCFSFSYYKPLSSCGGGGGMLCFNDRSYLQVANFIKIWGHHEGLLHTGQRFSRMSLLDLMSVKVKWKYLKDIIKTRRQVKKIYENGLNGCPDVSFFPDAPDVVSVPQNFVCMTKHRDALGQALERSGIIWQRPYTPLHQINMFKPWVRGEYPQSDRYAQTAIHLPLFSFMTTEEAEFVINAVRAFQSD